MISVKQIATIVWSQMCFYQFGQFTNLIADSIANRTRVTEPRPASCESLNDTFEECSDLFRQLCFSKSIVGKRLSQVPLNVVGNDRTCNHICFLGNAVVLVKVKLCQLTKLITWRIKQISPFGSRVNQSLTLPTCLIHSVENC